MSAFPHRAAALLAAGLVAVTTLTGCGAATTSTAATIGTSANTPRTAPVTGPASPAAPSSAAPALANTGTSWPKIVGSLITYGQWLLANPNPNLASTIAVPGCAADNALTAELRARVEEGTYVQPAAPVLIRVSGPVGALGGQVTVDIQAVRGAEPVHERARTGSTTHVVSDRPALPPTALRLSLIRGSDSRWRFCTTTDDMNPDRDVLTNLL